MSLLDQSRAVVRAWGRHVAVVDVNAESEIPTWNDVNAAIRGLAKAVSEAPSEDGAVSGPTLAAERLTRRIRVGAIAEAMGVSPTYVSAIERNPKPTPSVITRYRAALDMATATVAMRDTQPVVSGVEDGAA